MADGDRRDAAIEKLLARSLRDVSPLDACPDAELVAAYCERSLCDAELAHLESHLASCARCQAQLAALVRSESAVPPSPAEAAQTRLAALLSWRWLAPLATAAVVALAVWVIQPGSLDEQRPAERTETADALSVPAPVAAPPVAAPPAAAPPAAPAEAESRRERVQAEQAAEMASTAPEAAAADRAAGGVEEQPPLGRAAPATPGRAVSSQDAALVALKVDAADTATITIRTPAPSAMWRVTAQGAIERTTDAGATWQLQVAETGAQLLAGSAPSETVCWMVGRAGSIWRTLDGQRWEPVNAPVRVDLTAVEATDGRTATVLAATGVRYQTSDGGETWLEIRD